MRAAFCAETIQLNLMPVERETMFGCEMLERCFKRLIFIHGDDAAAAAARGMVVVMAE